MSINKHRSRGIALPDLLQDAAALHLRETTAADFPRRRHPKNTRASKTIDEVARDVGVAIDPVRIEFPIEHLAKFVAQFSGLLAIDWPVVRPRSTLSLRAAQTTPVRLGPRSLASVRL